MRIPPVIAKPTVLLLLCCLCGNVFAGQPRDVALKRALKAYAAFHYDDAVFWLNKAMKNRAKLSQDLLAEEMMATSLLKLHRNSEALLWYRKLVNSTDPKPSWQLHYAQLLASKRIYDSAGYWYGRYAGLMPHDERAKAFAKAYADTAKLLVTQPGVQVYFTNLNTESADFSPTFYKQGLIFVSNRNTHDMVKSINGWDKTPYDDLYVLDNLSVVHAVNPDSIKAAVRKNPGAYKKQLHYQNTARVEASANDNNVIGYFNPGIWHDTLGAVLEIPGVHKISGDVHTRFHEGPVTVLPDSSIMFTRSNFSGNWVQRSTDGVNHLKIYATKGRDFKNVSEFMYDDNEYSVAHPAVTPDGSMLLFASDMPGGYGGSDLYYCLKDKGTGTWLKPVNMGRLVNTEGNESFPFVDAGNVLYFASDGQVGYGGLDVFKISLENNRPVGTAQNMGAPFNTEADDFGFIVRPAAHMGFFSSNRRGNDDIYGFSF